MIEYAKIYLKDFNNVFLKVGNGRNLSSFKDNTFDLIYSFITLQHLERYIAYTYLVETYRVLKNSGRAFINLMSLNDLTWGHLYKTIKEHINNDNFYISDFLCVANPWMMDEAMFIFKQIGFQIERYNIGNMYMSFLLKK